VARELCDGLGAIHDCGVLHRDFKPANVLIDREGHPRITDFGLAAPGEAGGRIEGRAAAAGTPGYIAPEAIAGRECTKRSDIYALGLVLFEVFTGRRAYSGDSGEQLLKQQETIDPPVPSEIVRDIDPLVERVILRCVERDPLDRPESVKHISRMLPGGDPLAAAIALGETPSPEVVAASGQVGRMPAWAACGVFALILVGVAVLLMLAPRATLVGVTPLEMSPEVLTDRAKQILHDIGYKRTPASSVSSLDYYQELMGEIARAPEFGSPGDKWKVLHGPRPTAIDFWYRQSLSRLTPVSPTGRPTWTDPSPIEPGMIGVRLSTGGLLRELSVMPYDTYSLSPSLALEESEGATPRNIDETWDLLFRASGLDRSKFEEATPARVPPQFADARAAWRGVYPDNAEIQIRVEAAALRGLPVSFRVVEERWSRASELAFTPEPNAKRELGAVLEQVVQWVSLVGALVLARHNWNRKRGDRESARRLGIGAFVFSLLGMLLTMRVIDVTSGTGSQSSGGFVSMRAADVLRSAVGTSIFSGAWLWLFYIAIEPMIRRTWPETLISWARLQAARWRDPLVGKSILLGVGIGVLSMVLIYVEQVVPRLLGESAPPLFDPQWGLLTMEGTRVSVGVLMLQAVGAMRFALIFLMGLVLIRLVVRSAVWAAVLFSSVQTIVWSLAWGSSWAGWPIFAIVAGICTIVVVRLGLLSLAVAFLSAFVLLAFPLTLDTSAWYADNAALGVGVVMTLAVLGTLGATGMFSGSRLIAGAAGATSRA
jgi:serine/threonine-protein kinase